MNKQAITEQLTQAIWASENAHAVSEDPFLNKNRSILNANLIRAARAFSGSWIGYHAYVYYRGFEIPPPGDHFNSEFGLTEGGLLSKPTSDTWVEYLPESVRQALMEGIDPEYVSRLTAISAKAQEALEENYEIVRTLLEVLQTDSKSPTLQRISEDLSNLQLHFSPNEFIRAKGPKGQFITADSLALSQGILTPVHIKMLVEEIDRLHPFMALDTFIGCARRILKYMEINDLVERKSMPHGKKVFVGHGHSPLWREVKDLAISGFRNGWMGAKCRLGKGFMKDLSEPERGWNLFGDVHVADGEENEVGKGFQRAKAAGAILDHSDEAIDAFTGGIG